MSFVITEWNLNPNRLWFIKLSDIGSTMQIDLYPTEADADADTNKVATASAFFGTNVEIILEMTETGTPAISLFNSSISCHLKVSGADSDTTKIFQISPFVDLPDINNSIYRTEALIHKKAINEINKHTHIAIRRDIGIAVHVPSLQIGDICRMDSTRRDMDILSTLDELLIIGTKDSLINQIGTVEYTDLNYG